jgi:hypothetical protein
MEHRAFLAVHESERNDHVRPHCPDLKRLDELDQRRWGFEDRVATTRSGSIPPGRPRGSARFRRATSRRPRVYASTHSSDAEAEAFHPSQGATLGRR